MILSNLKEMDSTFILLLITILNTNFPTSCRND